MFKKVFVLCGPRTGSTTFCKACQHMTNYTASHERNHQHTTKKKLTIPDYHIAVDGTMWYFLGSLDKMYGDDAFYVYHDRPIEESVPSVINSFNGGKTGRAWADGIIFNGYKNYSFEELIRDMYENCYASIEMFLKDKTNVLRTSLYTMKEDFPKFWDAIGAKGDFDKAMAEWDKKHNNTKSVLKRRARKRKGGKRR